jgi:hypothetical protein
MSYLGQQLLIGSIHRFPRNEGMVMFVRQLTTASMLSLALISLPGSAHAQAGPLAYCKEDAARLCPGVSRGGGKLIGCLKQHQNQVSIGCAKELKAVKTKMGK